MKSNRLSLSGVLSPEQIQRLHDEALGVIERIGIKVPDAELREALADRSGVRFRDDRACIDRKLVEEMVAEHRQRMADGPPPMTPQGQVPEYANREEAIWLMAGTHARWWHDPQTDEIRPSRVADQVTAAKLIYGLRDQRVAGSTSGAATDLPEPLQSVTQTYVSLRFTGRPMYASIQSAEEMAWILDLYEAAGQPCHLPMHLISPLRFEGNELDIVRATRQRLASVHVSNMPICGASAPLFIPGGLVLAMAEVLAGYTLMRLLWPDMQINFSIALFCMDFKRGGMVYGTPEHNLADLARMAVNRFYGVPAVGTRSIRSMAKKPGVQASAERAASAVVGALAGSRAFYGAGLLSLDEIFSPLQLVIDCEIRDWAERFAAGIEFGEETLSVDVIEEAALGAGEFLSHEQTLTEYRRMYWMPRLFDYGMLGSWLAGESRDVLDAARDAVAEAIGRYDYSPPEDLRKRIDAVYERICRQFSVRLETVLRE